MNTAKTEPKCTHLAHVIDIGKLQTILDSSSINNERCTKCKAKEMNGESLELWMCLKCGINLCGCLANMHAQRYHMSQSNDSHALVMNTST